MIYWPLRNSWTWQVYNGVEKDSKLCLLVIGPYKAYPTCIKMIIPKISELGQTIHKMAQKAIIIPVCSKSLYKSITEQTLTNGINSLKMDTKYIRHTYSLNIGVGMNPQSHPRR